MKKRSIIALGLATIILSSCDSGIATGETSSGLTSVETTEEITAAIYEQVEYYRIEPTCYRCNFIYDIRNYYIKDNISKRIEKDVNVTADDLKTYADEKLDRIESEDETSVRGIYQNYGFEIVRRDKFSEWEKANGFSGQGIMDGYVTYIYYDVPIADGGALTKAREFGIMLDPSERFVIVHNCYDFKILYEFFNGRYNPEENEVPVQDELSEEAKEVYGYLNIQPPFYCASFIAFDITGDGNDDYCYTVSGGDGFYRSFVLICDPVTEMSNLYFSLDFDYSLEVVDGQLILTVDKGENCQVDMFPDQEKTEILVIEDEQPEFPTRNIFSDNLYVGNYKEWNLFKREQKEDEYSEYTEDEE